jgi:hypothetical protein
MPPRTELMPILARAPRGKGMAQYCGSRATSSELP